MLDGTRHLFALPRGRGPSQTPKFLSPGPPLSLAAGTAHREPLPIVFALNRRLSVAPGTCLAGSVSAAGGKPTLSFPQRQGEPMPRGFRRGDARGEAPCIRKLKIPPSRREGGRGDGGKKVSQRQGRQATKTAVPPRRVPVRQGYPTTTSLHPPPGSCNAGLTSAARVQPRGCKGRSPLHKITLSPPFPTGEGGWGDRGQTNKLKAWAPLPPKNKSSNIHRRVMCRTPQSGMIRSRNHRA